MDADADRSARTATDSVLGAWGLAPLTADEARLPDQIETVAWRRGSQELPLVTNRSMLRLLDLPAVVALRVPGFLAPRYVGLVAMDVSRTVVSIDGVPVTVETEVMDRYWSGSAHVLWRDFDGLGPMLALGARGIAVVRLQELLRRAGAMDLKPSGVFDEATHAAVLDFQRAHQLETDGRVGPFTRIAPVRRRRGYERPTLSFRAEERS